MRWTADGRRLISTGGADRCSFQWRLIRPKRDHRPQSPAKPPPKQVIVEEEDEMATVDVAELHVKLQEQTAEAEAQREIAEERHATNLKLEADKVAAEKAAEMAREELQAAQMVNEQQDGEGQSAAKLAAELEAAREQVSRWRESTGAAKAELERCAGDKDALARALVRTNRRTEPETRSRTDSSARALSSAESVIDR